MNKPKMIIFDYGHTLLCEPDYNLLRATQAVMQYAVSNPRNLSAEQVCEFSSYLWHEICGPSRREGIELHNDHFERLLYEYLQIELSISPAEIGRVFFNGVSTGEKMPNIEVVLDYLHQNGIRSGVISNISFSEETLRERINSFLPDNRFEFIIASSEYMVRKPNPLIFELALNKANLSADEVWYCGDNPVADIDGAAGVGIFPVWYRSGITNEIRDKSLDTVVPSVEHLYISDWLELIAALEGLRG